MFEIEHQIVRVLHMISSVTLIRVLPPQEIGRIALYGIYVEFLAPVLPLLLVLTLAFRLKRDSAWRRVPADDPIPPDIH